MTSPSVISDSHGSMNLASIKFSRTLLLPFGGDAVVGLGPVLHARESNVDQCYMQESRM